jgi:thioesterase domain-containing protein
MPVEIRPGETQLAAYVVYKPGQSPAIAELRGYLRKQLPDYMIPTAFVELDALPLTPNGKIDRKSLAAPEHVRHGLGGTAAPPRTFYEAVLAGIWAGVLGLDDVGIHDNFFDLGGHSLLAPAIISKAQTLLRVTLPLRSLFESPTVAGLARAVEEARRFKSAAESWTPVVELQRGTSSLPFFCVHAGGGGVGCYLDLVRHLGSDQTFYGIQAPEHGEMEPAAPRFESVEEMAACYAGAVRATQPQGPYLLGGWSAGGVIAFEMAQQLKRQGHEVALLALFDCMPRSIMASKLEPGAMAFLYAKAMAASSGRDLSLSFDSMRDADLSDQVTLLVDALKRAGILPHETKVDWFRGLLDGVRARSQSLARYSPAVYPGKITLFRGREIDPEFIKAQNALDHRTVDYRDRTNGWSGLSSEPVEVYEVPGHHYTIVLEPHVGDLARQLRSCIGRALEMSLGTA